MSGEGSPIQKRKGRGFKKKREVRDLFQRIEEEESKHFISIHSLIPHTYTRVTISSPFFSIFFVSIFFLSFLKI